MGGKKFSKQRKRDNKKKQERLLKESGEPDLRKQVKKEAKDAQFKEKSEEFFINPVMSTYYKTVLKQDFKDEDEFNEMWNMFKIQLPVTFRISPNCTNYEIYQKKLLQGDDYILNLCKEGIEEARQDILKNEEIQKQNEIFYQQKKEEQEKQKEENIEIEQEVQETKEEQIKRIKELNWHQIQADKTIIDLIDKKQLNFKPIECIEGNLGFQLPISKEILKKGKALKKFHNEIHAASEAGIITRQELVSMLPPLLLDVQAEDKIFDMCAAPGSKTSQILDTMYYKAKKPENVTGCVLANDKDIKRAFMLCHQMNRGSLSAMMITNHDAQSFPALKVPEHKQTEKYDQKLYFDKVQADVPCTGDGATRKIFSKFIDWTTRDGLSLFSIQLQILLRAISIAKPGGLIVYSTCSINPIEDEAVVTEALRKAIPGSLELLDCHSRIPGIKGRKGLTQWPVLVNKLRKSKMEDKSKEALEKFTYEELFEEIQKDQIGQFSNEQLSQNSQLSLLKTSMFPESEETMKKLGLEKTMRILPHDQNTGGFYLALFRKKSRSVFSTETVFDPSKIVETNENETFVLKEENQQELQKQQELEQKQEQQQQKEEEESKIEQEQQQQNKQTVDQTQQELLQLMKKEEEKNQNLQQKKKIRAESIYEKYDQIPEEIYNLLVENYGISGLDISQLMLQQRGNNNSVRIITQQSRLIFDSDKKQDGLKLVNLGQRVFKKESNPKDGQFNYRLCNDGIQYIFPYMTKRQFKVTPEQFLFLINDNQIKIDTIEDKEFVKQIQDFGRGSCAIYTEINGNKEIVSGQIFHSTISTLISQETKRGLQLLYQGLQ